MTVSAREIVELATGSLAYEPVEAGEHVIATDRYLLVMARSAHPASNCVQRMASDDVAATVREVRTIALKHGRTALTREATTRTLVMALQELGMTPDDPPTALVMAMRRPPTREPQGVVVSRVDSIDALRTFVALRHEAFGRMDELAAELEHIDRTGALALADEQVVRYLAHIDGEPVAMARATFTERGVILNGGATLAKARGRGAYRAHVGARWYDAVQHGTPLLVTRSGPMSQPILRKLGFEELGEIHFLIDRFVGDAVL